MGDLPLKGSQGWGLPKQEVIHRQIKDGVSLDQIKAATANNNLDEMVVEDQHGQKFISYADELTVVKGALPKVGDKVNLPFIDGEAKVVHVDNEMDESNGRAVLEGLLPFIGNKIADKWGDKGGDSGDAKSIREISQPLPKPNQQELHWAKELEKRVKSGDYTANKLEIKKYTEIYIRHTSPD